MPPYDRIIPSIKEIYNSKVQLLHFEYINKFNKIKKSLHSYIHTAKNIPNTEQIIPARKKPFTISGSS